MCHGSFRRVFVSVGLPEKSVVSTQLPADGGNFLDLGRNMRPQTHLDDSLGQTEPKIPDATAGQSGGFTGNDLSVVLWPLDQVKPYHRNPRKNDHAVAAVVQSIVQFGFRVPIVVDADGVIVCGHTRWKAAGQIGLEFVPVHVAADLPPDKVRAFRIADNATAELSEWDYELLPLELADAKAEGTSLEALGLGADVLAKLSEPAPAATGVDPDVIPAPPDAAITTPGTIWILGDHRLMCGDSSKPADLDELLAGARIHLCNTDPPYNVKVEPRSNNAIAAGMSSFGGATHHQQFDAQRGDGPKVATDAKLRPKDRPLANDFISEEDFDRILAAWYGNIARVLEPGRAFYIWGGYANIANYLEPMKAAGLYFSQAIIWVKDHAVLTRKDFMGNHEWCFYGWREGAAHEFFGENNVQDTWRLERTLLGDVALGRGVRVEAADGSRIDVLPPDDKRALRIVQCGEGVDVHGASEATDVWHVKKVTPQKMMHLTEKPVELAERAMRLSSLPGENVLDLFGGSGSTLIAAERMGRKAFLMEMDALYCDVIVQRWENYTGKKAERLIPRGAA